MVTPKEGLVAEKEAALAAKLKAYKDSLSEDEIKKIFLSAGFSQVDSFSPLTFDKPKADDMRIVYVAK